MDSINSESLRARALGSARSRARAGVRERERVKTLSIVARISVLMKSPFFDLRVVFYPAFFSALPSPPLSLSLFLRCLSVFAKKRRSEAAQRGNFGK